MTLEEFYESETGIEVKTILRGVVGNAVYEGAFETERLLVGKVKTVTTKGGQLDPTKDENNEPAQRLYIDVARRLRKSTYLTLPERMLLNAWDSFGALQASENRRIHRGLIGFELMSEANRKNNPVLAMRWALLTQADDLLGRHENGSVRDALSRFFGITDTQWNQLKTIVYSQIDKAESEGWVQPFAFPEDTLLTLIQNSKIWPYLLTGGQNNTEFHLSTPFLAALLKYADAPVRSNSNPNGIATQEKGNRLEKLAYYLCSLLPGCIPSRNISDQEQAYESDIVVQNLNPVPNIVCDLLGRHFLIECKNWSSDSVPVAHVGYFLFRIKLTHTRFGILFAANGITGDTKSVRGENEKAARALIRRAYHEDATSCVVLSRSDIESLIQGGITFWQLLLSKMDEFRFGISRDADHNADGGAA